MSESLEREIFGTKLNNPDKQTERYRNLLRGFLVLCTFGISVGIPNFQQITGLTGAFGNNVLGFIMPPLMILKLSKNEIPCHKKFFAYFICLFGVAMFIICTAFFIIDIISSSSSSCS